jgi:hypothetical protein
MRVRSLIPGLAIGLVLALGGCGSDDDTTTGSTSASTASTAAATAAAPVGGGQTITGTGYRTVVPADWKDGAELTQGTAIKVDRIYASQEGSAFKANVLVIRENPKAIADTKIEDIEEDLRKQAAGAVGAEVPEAEEPTKLDGEDAVRWTLRRKQGDVDLAQLQLGAIHDGALYSVTLSSAAADEDQSREQFERLIDGWRWE